MTAPPPYKFWNVHMCAFQLVFKYWFYNAIFSLKKEIKKVKFFIYTFTLNANLQHGIKRYTCNLNFTEAEAYIKLLQTEGVNKPVDVDADSCTIQLPDWYDPNLFKRCVPLLFVQHMKLYTV